MWVKLNNRPTKDQARFIFLFILLHILTAANAPIAWHLVKSASNIQVFTSNVPNYPVKGIRAEVVFDAPITQVLKVAMDVNHYPNWIYKCKKSVLVKQVSAQEVIYYHITDAPWPVADRDQYSVTKLSKHIDGSYWMHSHTLPDYRGNEEGNVRIKNGKATWHFIPLANGQTKGEYELFFNPEGYIPSWIINLFIAEGPYVTMLNMQKEIGKQRFLVTSYEFEFIAPNSTFITCSPTSSPCIF